MLREWECNGSSDGLGRTHAEPAGTAVSRVSPDPRQAGDHRGETTTKNQSEPGGQLPDHVGRGDVVAGGVVLAAEPP